MDQIMPAFISTFRVNCLSLRWQNLTKFMFCIDKVIWHGDCYPCVTITNEDNKMADEDKDEGSEEGNGGSKKKLIILIVAALVLIGGGVGGVMMFMGGGEEVADGEEGAVEETEEPKNIVYLPFAKPLVVNFQAADGKTRFLKTEVTLMAEDEARIDDIKKHLPKIQHVVNLVFSRQVFEELGTPEGKEKMRMEALQEIKSILKKPMGDDNVDDILYTNFVTQ